MLTVCMAINLEATGSHSMFTCEPITLRMCQGLSYNTTFMPNLLNHYDQQTAALAMEVNHMTQADCLNDVIKLQYINLHSQKKGTKAVTGAVLYLIYP